MFFDPGKLFVETVSPLDSDYLDYCPLQDETVPVSSTRTTKLSALSGERAKFFQFGQDYDSFLQNKINTRKLPTEDTYQNKLSKEQVAPIIRWLLKTLTEQNPVLNIWDRCLENPLINDGKYAEELLWSQELELISPWHYSDLFDALACQVVEDFAVITLDPTTGKDEATLLHLCAPSDWSTEWAFGKSFGEIHEKVRRGNGNLVIPNPSGMVQGLIKLQEPVQRVGSVSFRPSNLVNRHLKYVPPDVWTWGPEQKAFVRFERQVVVPFPEINSFLLIIRSYYNNLLDPKRTPAAIRALDNLSPDVYHKVFLNKEAENLKSFLKTRV